MAYEVNADEGKRFHEAQILKLDCTKASVELGWEAVWDTHRTFEKTANWYKAYYEEHTIMTDADITDYMRDASQKWVAGLPATAETKT